LVWEIVESVGARPKVIEPEAHDRLMAGVSHTAFAVSVAYIQSLLHSDDWPQMAEVAGPGFRDMTRLAGGDPNLYAAIVATNRRPMIEALRGVETSLARLRQLLESGDPRVVELFEEARRAKAADR
jgi:prephenate dehydrogenase